MTNPLGSKDEIARLLADFDLIRNPWGLPVWILRLVNGLRHEWKLSQDETQKFRMALALLVEACHKRDAGDPLFNTALEAAEKVLDLHKHLRDMPKWTPFVGQPVPQPQRVIQATNKETGAHEFEADCHPPGDSMWCVKCGEPANHPNHS
jgi:hypothetical protein